MAKKQKAPAGSRWITIHGGTHSETGEHTGRHVLIDKNGAIIGGAVPKSWQGHSFDDALKGAAKDLGDSYHGYSHDELKQVHKDFSDSHKQMKQDLAGDVHGLAAFLRDQDADGEKEGSIIKQVNAIGKIHFGSNPEYQEDFKDIHPGVKKAIGTQKSKQGMGIDVMADELGMSPDDLIDHLKAASPYRYKKIGDYHEEAKKQMGKDYTNRLKDLEHMGKHVKAIEAAMNRHKHGTVKKEQDEKHEQDAQNIWKQFAGAADKQIPGSKEAHDKGGAKGLMDHIATTSPKQYEALKKNMADKVNAGGDKISEGQKRANDMLQKHKAPKQKAEPKAAPPQEPKAAEGPDKIDQHNEKLAQFAKRFKSAEDFENAIKPGMGQVSHADLHGMIDDNSHNHLDAKGIKSQLSQGGKHYFLSKVDPSKLNIQDEQDLKGVHPDFDQSKTKPIIVGKDGFVVDGRHRAVSAKNNGAKSMHAYVSAKDFYNQHVGAQQEEAPPMAADKPVKGAEGSQQTEEPKKGLKVIQGGKKSPLDELHGDAEKYMKGEGDVNDILKKHDKLITRMAQKTAEERGGHHEAEDLAQHGRIAAAKTLEALKNGTQKPKEGTSLGQHLARRIKQGISEGARQSNDNSLSRGGAKLAAVINSERQKHLNETGQEPSEDQLFNRVKDNEAFKGTKFTKPGTKQSLEDREKFDEVRKAAGSQRAKATLDQDVKGKDGDNAGTVGSNIADKGGSAEDQAVQNEEANEAEQQKQDQIAQIGDAMKEFGLSPSQAQAVIHRFGVGHGDDSGVVKDWDEVAKHMSKNMGKEVNGETAKRHYYDGLKKLHKHIGDERMAGLLQKSLIDTGDMGAYMLVKSLYELALLDLMKSHDLVDTAEFTKAHVRFVIARSMPDLLKSLDAKEYLGGYQIWSDGSVSANIEAYHLIP